jgi:two-component system, OmpR family, sensor histidine kinase PrrB
VLHAATAAGAAVQVDVTVERGPGKLRLTVDDDGPGIPPAERAHVLGRFARGSGTRGQGSGLGLALVDQQVQLHHGALEIGDSPLGGARVQVRLPDPHPAR